MNEVTRKRPAVPGELLRTKLLPPRLNPSLVARSALFLRLDDGLSKKMTLVTAPTGFGKTSLVSMWLGARNLAAAWVTLDEGDNDPVRFWTYVIHALRTFDASLGKPSLSMLRSSQPSSLKAMLVPLMNSLAELAQPCVLVLEDYNTITSPEVNESLAFFLNNLPEQLHLILLTRTEPPLALATLRARDELVELHAHDLRFTHAEIEEFLRQAVPAALSAGAVAQLEERTEGWIAGLRLAALALQDKLHAPDAEQFITSFSGSHRYVFEYLMKEAFESQPESTQSFLLQTCFLNRMDGSLCDAVTGRGDSAQMLEHLDRANLFLSQLDNENGHAWYRYHALFSEAMHHFAVQRIGEDALCRLYEKASGWYEEHRMTDEAVELAMKGRLYGRAASLIEQMIELQGLKEFQTLRRWAELMPTEELYRHPVLCFNYALVLLFSMDRYSAATAARLEPLLRAAEDAWRVEGNHAKLGYACSTRGLMAWWQGDIAQAFEYSRQALSILPEDDVANRGNSLLIVGYEELFAGRIEAALNRALEARALVGAAQNKHGVLAAMQLLCEISYQQGDFEQVNQLANQVLAEAVGSEEMLDDQGGALMHLANVAYEQNDLDTAEQLATRAQEAGAKRLNEWMQADAIVRLAYIHGARGAFGKAKEMLQKFAPRARHAAVQRQLHAAQARIALMSGELPYLQHWQQTISAPIAPFGRDGNNSALYKELETFLLARVRIAENDPGGALDLVKSWREDAAQQGRTRSEVEALSIEALAHAADHNSEQACQSLAHALKIAQPKGFRRLFLDEGQPMAALLQIVAPALAKRTFSIYAGALQYAFNQEGTARPAANGAEPSALIEPLSSQEMRVLRLLAAGRSNPEIAQELVVSVNTVKTQVKSIFRKLNANSREEAREIARELDLL